MKTRIGIGCSPCLGFQHGGGVFDPSQVANLKHYSPDQSTLNTTGSLVDSIEDVNGSAVTIESLTTGRPTTGTRTINSLNGLDFDGSSDWMRFVDAAFLNHSSDGFTFLIALQMDVVPNSYVQLIGKRGADGSREYNIGHLDNTSGIIFTGFNNSAAPQSATVLTSNFIPTINTPFIVCGRYSGASGSMELFVNSKTAADSATGITIKETSENVLFNSLGAVSSFMNGIQGDIMYAPYVDDTKKDNLIDWLANKYGVTLT